MFEWTKEMRTWANHLLIFRDFYSWKFLHFLNMIARRRIYTICDQLTSDFSSLKIYSSFYNPRCDARLKPTMSGRQILINEEWRWKYTKARRKNVHNLVKLLLASHKQTLTLMSSNSIIEWAKEPLEEMFNLGKFPNSIFHFSTRPFVAADAKPKFIT